MKDQSASRVVGSREQEFEIPRKGTSWHLAFALLAVMAFWACSTTRDVQDPGESEPASYPKQAVFEATWNLVDQHYVDPDFGGNDWARIRQEYAVEIGEAEGPDEVYPLLIEMVDVLDDEHSRFLPPVSSRIQQEVMEGGAIPGGIGIMFEKRPIGDWIVTYVIPGGGADRAGVQNGSLIESIDGVSVARVRSSYEIVRGVVGPVGSTTTLTLQTPGGDVLDYEIPRTRVDLADVWVRGIPLRDGSLLYLEIISFDNSRVTGRIREIVTEHLEHHELDGIIVDVRRNGGGSLEVLRQTLGVFVNGGAYGRHTGRGETITRRARFFGTIRGVRDVPTIVLTSRYTQSAAELFAIAMRELADSLILGMPTRGNTEMVSHFALDDGSRLSVVTMNFQLLDGGSVEGIGLQPDVHVESRDRWLTLPVTDDPHVRAAMRILESDTPRAGSRQSADADHAGLP